MHKGFLDIPENCQVHDPHYLRFYSAGVPEGRNAGGRIVLVVGLAFLLVGVVAAVVEPDGINSPTAGLSIRVGAVLAALGVSMPLWRRPSATASLGLVVLVGLVLLRPSLIWVAVLVALGWALFGRQRKRADRDS